jgi:hypothetical protein
MKGISEQEFAHEVIQRFIETNPFGINEIIFEDNELTIYFERCAREPWGIQEFLEGSPTKVALKTIYNLLYRSKK